VITTRPIILAALAAGFNEDSGQTEGRGAKSERRNSKETTTAKKQQKQRAREIIGSRGLFVFLFAVTAYGPRPAAYGSFFLRNIA
jgi:hypothetical protein